MYGENVNLSLLLKTANTQSNTGKQLNLAQDTHHYYMCLFPGLVFS